MLHCGVVCSLSIFIVYMVGCIIHPPLLSSRYLAPQFILVFVSLLFVYHCRRFCQSANFQGWYNQKRMEANSKLQELHVKALCETNWVQWTVCRQEVEVVDLLLRMNEKLVRLVMFVTTLQTVETCTWLCWEHLLYHVTCLLVAGSDRWSSSWLWCQL